MGTLARARHAYASIALYALNVVLLAVVLNLAAAPFAPEDAPPAGATVVRARYGPRVDQAYPGVPRAEVDALLDETWTRPLQFEPHTMFREPAHTGRYVNVHAAGFRLVADQGPWPPDSGARNVFVFGGSTTFGYGVADGETVASHLQRELGRSDPIPVHVYNFGRGFYYSSQERILFEELLAAGHVPDLAVFVDGLNELDVEVGEVQFAGRFEDTFAPEHGQAARLLKGLPAVRVARATLARLRAAWKGPGAARGDGPPRSGAARRVYSRPEKSLPPETSVAVEQCLDRYLANKQTIEAVAQAHAVRVLFAWQPAPTYALDPERHLFAEGGFGRHALSAPGYTRMAERTAAGTVGKNFVWCADLQKNLEGVLYVDKVHYGPVLHRALAAAIAREIERQHLLLDVEPTASR